jgi:hypothetical protein
MLRCRCPVVAAGVYIGGTTPSTRAEQPPPLTNRSSALPKDQLTEADIVDYRITFCDAGRTGRTIRAAYVTSEDKHPDMLVFKDAEHRTVYMVSRQRTLEVERLEPERGGERKPASEQVAGGGFVPTSEAMERAGIKPEDFR